MEPEELTDRLDTYLNRRHIRYTPFFCVALLAWFALQIVVFNLFNWSGEQFGYWLSSNPSHPLSPGALTAPLSHASIPHLVGNVVLLLLYGSAGESHLSSREWLAFLMITAYVPLHTSSLLKVSESLGASTAVLAFVGFYHTHLLVSHRDSLVFLDSTGKILPTDERTRRYYLGLFALLAVPLLWLFFASGVIGIRSTGNADSLGHILGFSLGILYGVLKPVLSPIY